MQVLSAFIAVLLANTPSIETAIQSIAPTTFSVRYVSKITKSVKIASKITGIDPYLLVAVMRVESDFVPAFRLWPECKDINSRRCRADCGITQHHIVGPTKWVLRTCRRLVRHPSKTATISAKELMRHFEWCGKHAHLKKYRPTIRCVLNRYNAGPKYRTREICNYRYGWRCTIKCPTDERLYRERSQCIRKCYRKRGRCFYYANYWKRVMCFMYGAVTGEKPLKNCRKVKSISEIEKFYQSKPSFFKAFLNSTGLL